MGDELTKEQAMAANGEETAYSAIYDYSLDSFKATNKTIKDCADTLDVKTKNNKITEKSLKTPAPIPARIAAPIEVASSR